METSTRGHKIALFLACFAGPAQVGAAACSSAKPPATQVRPTAEASSEPEAEPLPLPPLHVLQRLRGSEAERRACFEVSGEALDGFVKLAWEVTSEGRVDEVLIEGTSVHNQQVEQCLAQAVKAMDFGPRPHASDARWTFVHRLPKMPGVDEAIEAKRKKKKKREEQEVTGVSIEEASPGSLDLQRIENIVHAGFPLFAYCYRSGLERDPTLSGLVHLRFVIDEEGAVMGVMDSGSEFRDKSALDCMAEGIFALNFPPPQGGDVRVQYRIVFESG